ncbi:MAG: nitroreductase family protein [Oscillospiraceae bacterium]|nr:nitroreductase family protein [Oscillospiraceae bacterium]
MDIMEAMRARHSVRSYTDAAIEGETLAKLEAEIAVCNRDSGLHIQLVRNEPKAFDCMRAHYGRFSGVRNYIALVGRKDERKLEELCGYYGEMLVLAAQALGLNTCWVGASFQKVPNVFQVYSDEKLVLVIAIGYGETQGAPHRSKDAKAVSKAENAPAWFTAGVEAALLAPTAINQQKFFFTLQGSAVSAKSGLGPFHKVDLGIAKYHFELGSGKGRAVWL